MIKRTFDIIAALFGLLLIAPLLLLLMLLIRLTSRGPALFCQQRVGRNFQPFTIYKLRTMVPEAPQRGLAITAGRDPRITWIGNILRKTKLDEFPQLWNVLKGDMSFVGPRPEVQKYVNHYRDDYATILQVRPGITDLASIAFSDESEQLGRATDPEREYLENILPQKMELAKDYVRRSSLWLDLSIIFGTLLKIWRLPRTHA
jgi:lipopolysaccharide/colanic/teichoic acid biosynthesis glycosyltransferase